MAGTYSKNYIQAVFAVKGRKNLISNFGNQNYTNTSQVS